jgi:hypothetical protein
MQVAKSLDGKADITIVDPKPTTHFSVGALRGLWDDAMLMQQFIPYPQFKSSTKFVVGEVVDATATSVKLKSGVDIPYDILVISTGSKNPAPAKIHAFSTVRVCSPPPFFPFPSSTTLTSRFLLLFSESTISLFFFSVFSLFGVREREGGKLTSRLQSNPLPVRIVID